MWRCYSMLISTAILSHFTPSMMTPDAWDRIAAAAKWAHAKADVLVDAHWVGGDQLKREPLRVMVFEANPD